MDSLAVARSALRACSLRSHSFRGSSAQVRAIPVIALTAHAMKGDEDACRDAGMDGYLSKPIDPQRLREALDAVAPRAT